MHLSPLPNGPGSVIRMSRYGAVTVRERQSAPAVSPKGQQLPALTGLRFFLALWVVFHHLTGPGMMLASYANGLVRGGYLAVTTFFVLSGFVLTRGYASIDWTVQSLKRYAAARFARIYPVYLLSLAAVAPFIAADPTPGKPFYLAMHLPLLQGWLGPIPVSWNTPAWSLSCEMFFYAVFPLALALLPKPKWTGTLLLAAVATCLTRILWRAGVSDGVKPLIHLSDFLMGIAAAGIYELLLRGGRQAPKGWWLYMPAGVLALGMIANPELLPAPLDITSTLRPLNALGLIGLALGGGTVARLLATPICEFLGKSSYALYILHVPLLWWYLRAVRQPSPWVYLAAAIGLSALVYRFIEEPANRRLRGWLTR